MYLFHGTPMWKTRNHNISFSIIIVWRNLRSCLFALCMCSIYYYVSKLSIRSSRSSKKYKSIIWISFTGSNLNSTSTVSIWSWIYNILEYNMHIMVFNVHYKDSTILEMVLDRTFLKSYKLPSESLRSFYLML